jgi:hypothetical protein
MRESYAPAILERKAKRLRKSTGNPNLKSKLDSGLTAKDLFIFSIVRPSKMILFSPTVFFLSLYVAVTYCKAFYSRKKSTELTLYSIPLSLLHNINRGLRNTIQIST